MSYGVLDIFTTRKRGTPRLPKCLYWASWRARVFHRTISAGKIGELWQNQSRDSDVSALKAPTGLT